MQRDRKFSEVIGVSSKSLNMIRPRASPPAVTSMKTFGNGLYDLLLSRPCPISTGFSVIF